MRKALKSVLTITLLSVCVQAHAGSKKIAVVGIDKNGEEAHSVINADEGHEGMVRLLTTVNKSVFENLAEEEVEASGYKMNKFSIGLGFQGEIGIAAWKIGTGVKQRVFFTKK